MTVPHFLHARHEPQPSGAQVRLNVAHNLWRALHPSQKIFPTGPRHGVFAAAVCNAVCAAVRAAGYATTHMPCTRNPLYFWHRVRFFKRVRFDVVRQHIEGRGFSFGLPALLFGCPLIRISRARPFVLEGAGVRRNEGVRFVIDNQLMWTLKTSRVASKPRRIRREFRGRSFLQAGFMFRPHIAGLGNNGAGVFRDDACATPSFLRRLFSHCNSAFFCGSRRLSVRGAFSGQCVIL